MYTEKTNIDDLLKKIINENNQNNFVKNLNESKQVNLVSEKEPRNSIDESIDKILHAEIFENANRSIEKIRSKLSNFSETFENKSFQPNITQHDLLDKIKIKLSSDPENQKFVTNSLLDEFECKDIPDWLINADFKRTETDLIAKYSNKEIIFSDYFTHHDLPSIITQNGLLLKGSTLKTLAGSLVPNQFAQISENEVFSIGEVSNVKGIVKALRLDANIYTLSTGDPVFKGDVIETDSNGSVGLTFLDKTTLSLSEGGKMVLDELVYDPATGAGDFAVDMLEGAFSFVSGEIAKNGEDSMTVTTPVATIGIRGTTVAGKAAVEGNENSFTLLQDAGGEVGEISISNSAGTQTLSQVGATTSVSSFNAPPPPPIILSAAEIQANYGTALDVLPPTPAIAPQPQSPPPPQEESQTSDEESETDEEDEDSEEISEEDEITEEENQTDEENEEIVEEENNEEDILEGDEELVAEDGESLGSQDESIDDAEEDILIESDSIDNEGLEDTNTSNQAEGIDQLIESETEEELLSDQVLANVSDSELLPEIEDSDGPGEFGANLGPNNIENEVLGSGVLAELGNNEFGGLENQGFDGVESLDSFGGAGVIGSGAFMNEDSFGIGLSSESSFFNSFAEEEMFISSMMLPGGDDYIYGTGLGDTGFLDGFIESYDSYNEEMTDEYFEDPSLYDDYQITNNDIEEETVTSSDDESSLGTSGNDNLDGTNANDTISGLAGNDIINGFEGNDVLEGNDGLDTIRGGEGNDTIQGGNANDTLYGGLGNDIIYGGAGEDTINGGNGIDTIYGGVGNDEIQGGLGYDNFVFTDITDAVDVIIDFEQGDRIVAEYNPSHPTFTRSGVEHLHNLNFTYDIDANGNVLPNFLNFTFNFDNIPSGDYSDPTEVSKAFQFNFYDSNDYYDVSSTVKTDFMLITGDGTNSAMFHWDDEDYDGSFYLDDSELTLLGTLENFDNDLLTTNELTTTLTYGA